MINYLYYSIIIKKKKRLIFMAFCFNIVFFEIIYISKLLIKKFFLFFTERNN
jgi:hypothetical protein